MRAPGWLLDLTGQQTPYAEAWTLQRGALSARQAGVIPDLLILLEHTPVVTLGRSARRTNLLVDPAGLAARGVELYEVERGGDVTYHGPGQLVGYPIIDLRALDEDVVRYMRLLEDSLIRTLAVYGIAAVRLRGFPGAWVGDAKIAAAGVAVKRRVTMHGFALNVTTDLDAFTVINPCGLGRPVTSMSRLLHDAVGLGEVGAVYARQFTEVFGIALEPVSRQRVERALAQEVAGGAS